MNFNGHIYILYCNNTVVVIGKPLIPSAHMYDYSNFNQCVVHMFNKLATHILTVCVMDL